MPPLAIFCNYLSRESIKEVHASTIIFTLTGLLTNIYLILMFDVLATVMVAL